MRFPVLAVAVGLLAAGPAFAHKLIVDAGPRGDRLRVEAYYEDETSADDAKVTVFQGETVVAEGKTDDRGVWTCPLPPPGNYRVKVLSVGHAATKLVPIGDPVSTDPDQPLDPDNRATATRTPWGRLGLGVGLILGVGLGWWLLRRQSQAHPHSTGPQQT